MDVVPYSRLAEHYDRLMGHVQYETWAASINKILKRVKKKPKRLLELGAGTCQLARVLEIPGLQFRVHTDLSLPMVHASGTDFPHPRLACDGCYLPFANESFDFILMCYDAVNYLNPAQLRLLFDEVCRVLEPGGTFLFDITTEENSIQWFEDYTDAFEACGGLLVRRSNYDAEKQVQHNYIDIFEPIEGDQYRRISEHHTQYIYPVPSIYEWLAETGLQLLDLIDAISLRPATPKSERIQVIAERA